MSTPAAGLDAREVLSQRLFDASIASLEVLSVYVGGALGLYRSLHQDGPANAPSLAERVGIAERYAREWLEQQAVAGVLIVDDPSAAAAERTYSLPEAHAEPLLDPESPFAIGPLIRFVAPIGAMLPALLDAFRSGSGVAWTGFGTEVIEAQGDFNRAWLLSSFGAEYLPSIADVHARLSDRERPARVADVACGAGWASIAIATAYPHVTVEGFDLDEHSIEIARRHAAEAGVADRVTFEVRDAGDALNTGRYDLAVVIEAIHDLSDPVGVLRAIRGMLTDGGVAVIADERVAETFTAPGDEIERLMYGFSLFSCLPAGLADTPSAGTGAVMRPDTLYGYAREAGFSRAGEIEAIEHPLLRFYRLDA